MVVIAPSHSPNTFHKPNAPVTQRHQVCFIDPTYREALKLHSLDYIYTHTHTHILHATPPRYISKFVSHGLCKQLPKKSYKWSNHSKKLLLLVAYTANIKQSFWWAKNKDKCGNLKLTRAWFLPSNFCQNSFLGSSHQLNWPTYYQRKRLKRVYFAHVLPSLIKYHAILQQTFKLVHVASLPRVSEKTWTDLQGKG